MKPKLIAAFLWITCIPPSPTGAASFINLDFESAMVPVTAPGEYGTFQPVSLVLPGWRTFIGVTEVSAVLHNNFTLGSPSISLFGPNFAVAAPGTILSGNFTVLMQPASSIDVSIVQVGLIPTDAQSVRFLAYPSSVIGGSPENLFGVFVDGQELDLVTLAGDEPGVRVFGANIPRWAGAEVELKFTDFGVTTQHNALLLDDIFFSSSPVPEPGAWALLLVGGLLGLGRLVVRSR